MPVLHFCRNIDAVTRFHFYSFFTFFLIISSSGNTYQDLPASTFCMMDVPVISASRFKCHIKNSNLRSRDWCKKTSAGKILCKAIVWCTDWKYHLFSMRTHRFLFVWQISFTCLPHFLCKIENSPCFWPSCIECNMCDHSSNLFLCHTMIFRILKMIF